MSDNNIPGFGHTDPRTDQGDEPQLHRVQVSPDQGPPLAEGLPCPNLPRGHRPGFKTSRIHTVSENHTNAGQTLFLGAF